MKQLSIFLFLLIAATSYSQKELVLDDRTGLVSDKVRSELRSNLAGYELNLVQQVDFSRKCDYLYLVLRPDGGNDFLRLLDCRDKVMATKSFGRDLKGASESERAVLLSVAIRNMLRDGSATRQPMVDSYDEEAFERLENEHYTRYYFSPSSFNLRKHEFYYNTLNFGVHDIQYGITDHFSIGMGTTVAFMPVYLTPKLSYSISDKHHVSLGDLIAYGTYVRNWYFNLLYGTYTYGTINRNITLGGAVMHTNILERNFNGQERSLLTSRPVFSLAGMIDVGPRLHFVSENYYTHFPQQTTGSFWDPNIGNEFFKELTYRTDAAFGFLGFRWTTRRTNTLAWQIGLGYLAYNEEDIREQYSLPENQPFFFWKENYGFEFYVFPSMSMTYKFGMVVR